MMAIQLLLGGRQRALVRGYDALLAHLAAALLGDGPGRSAVGIEELRARHAGLAEAGVPCALVHVLRLHAESIGSPGIEIVWHDLEAPPGRSGIVLRYRFEDGWDPAHALFRALSGIVSGADAEAVLASLERSAAASARTGRGEDARGRLDRMRKLQSLVAGGAGNPLAIVPSDAEAGGDHAGALASLPIRILERFEALAHGVARQDAAAR